MQNRRRASVRSRIILMGVIALVGAGLPALPASADDVSAPPKPGAAPGPLPAVDAAVARPTDQFIVKFKERAGIQSTDRQSSYGKAASAVGVPVAGVRATASGEEVVKTDRKLEANEATALVAALAADPNVEYAEPDVIMRLHDFTPNDPLFQYQWGTGDNFAGGIRSPIAWDINQGEGSVVAVIDSGILSHSDLNANVLPGYDMINDPAVSRDGNGRDANAHDEGDATTAGQCAAGEPAERSSWHGTHVAGIIAAVGNNGKGISGVAPKAKVVPVRVTGTCGGYLSDIVDGIAWAAGAAVPGVPVNANPARVINVSLGARGTCPAAFQNAIDVAHGKGAVVVVSAGNENIDASLVSPGNCRDVITVGATTKNESKAYYSNFGAAIDVMAPGGDMSVDVMDGIVSTLNNGTDRATTEDYYLKAGTSMAAPHVAGVAAMMLSVLPALKPSDVEAKLKATTKAPTCSGCGAGLINATGALRDVELEAAPIIGGTPVIKGEPLVGTTLTTDIGNWTFNELTRWTHQWNRNGVPIPGATDYSYTVVPEDLGSALTFTVTAKKDFTPTVTGTSAPTAAVKPGLLTTNIPSISGSPYVGNVLATDPGAWGPEPVELSYQWYRAGTSIPGAFSSSYTLVDADAGITLTVRVTGTKQGYTTVPRTSGATRVVVTADKAVTPSAVGFAEAPYVAEDKFTIPQSTGVEYQVAGATVPAGTYPARGNVKVTAKIKDGYALAKGATAEWVAFFSFKGPAYVPPAVSPFKDVLTKQQFYKEMAWLADRKISTGWVEADRSVTYRPLTPINRDAMAAFLYRMAGSPAYTPPAKSPFKDVLTTQQFYKEMAWLAESGISSGWVESDGSKTYRPLLPINRDAMAAFLYRLANKPDYEPPNWLPFWDVPREQQFYKEMAWMYEQGISKGWLEADGQYTYRPLAPINRDAMAAFLYRMP
ncbi:S8 family serine peptidase [Paenarthrobacter sp. GOM3]|uniref:S8 family serine peptidase n=1 Tax=Paenarthrobacter sp. GOM3 TaxID=2782567 RepID=UPI001BA905B5|nr:S8 family serine peptidase [Paenarthrobacter sp. GOM3]WOH17772.1 S8 family serine peptidase [Paenarthrobacter sp. GOM3]